MLFKKIKRYWMHIWKVSRKNFAGKYYTCKEKKNTSYGGIRFGYYSIVNMLRVQRKQ